MLTMFALDVTVGCKEITDRSSAGSRSEGALNPPLTMVTIARRGNGIDEIPLADGQPDCEVG
jgi:hypothetical protein